MGVIGAFILVGTLAQQASDRTAAERQAVQLQLALIDRDRQIANVQYDLGKKLLEASADKASAELSLRAAPLIERLRVLMGVAPDVPFDWTSQSFKKAK